MNWDSHKGIWKPDQNHSLKITHDKINDGKKKHSAQSTGSPTTNTEGTIAMGEGTNAEDKASYTQEQSKPLKTAKSARCGFSTGAMVLESRGMLRGLFFF